MKADGVDVSEGNIGGGGDRENMAGVGEINDLGEFGLGLAPKDSKPVNKIELTKKKEAEIADA